MKKILTFLLAFIALNTVSAQPVYHFGFKLGDVISSENIISAMSTYGTYFEPEESDDDDICFSYCFKDVVNKENKYDIVYFQSLKNGKLVKVGYGFVGNDRMDSRTLEDIYKSIADTIAVKYNMIEFSDSTTYYSLVSLGSVPTVSLVKSMEDGKDVSIELIYTSAQDLFLEAFKDINLGYPDIQDQFFGMKFGDKLKAYEIKDALASKATFLQQKREGDGTSYVFTDVVFAGNVWNYGTLAVTTGDEFYYCSFYDTWPDGYSYDDERRDAKNSFDRLKSRLDEKYGEVEIDTDDMGSYARYIGGNDVILILSNKRSQSSGGSYRRYVELTYVHRGIVNKQKEVSDDEL